MEKKKLQRRKNRLPEGWLQEFIRPMILRARMT
jgi:hypothetical protein